MNNAFVSALPDADMQATYKALLRAAQRAREIARLTIDNSVTHDNR